MHRQSRHPWRWALLLALCTLKARADGEWACTSKLSGHNFDFSGLGEDHVIKRERETPPTKMVDTLTFNLCKPLPESKDGAEADRCGPGTYACWKTVNQRSGESDRIIKVVPLATSSALNASVDQTSNGKISIRLHGPGYPSSSHDPQTLHFMMECAQANETPTILDYVGNSATVSWKNKAACQPANDPKSPPSDEPQSRHTGSGVGWFFTILLLGFIGYFALGAWHNYNNYGASGWDLVPHRDFWRDVPFLAKDVVSHLFSSVRGNQRSSRGGYVSV